MFKNVFTTLCTVITMFMIYQLIGTYAVEKPTTTTKLEKELETMDLTEVVICTEPGFDNWTLKNHGYHSTTYYRGALHQYGKFVGWNGDICENKSSHEMPILSETLYDMCNKKSNVSDNTSFEIFSIFWHLGYREMKFMRKSPCILGCTHILFKL